MQISVLTNIPNPYNGGLYRSLGQAGAQVEVHYRTNPRAAGRPWSVELGDHEHEDEGFAANWRAGRGARTSDAVVLSGGYHHPHELARQLPLARASVLRAFWGERLTTTHVLGGLTRRVLFHQIDLVLAIGSWAVPGYRSLVRAGVPVHVFPYTTTARRPVRTLLEGEPTVGYVGSLIHRKGVDVIIRALARMPMSSRPCFEVAGSGPLAGPLAALAEALGVRVHWLGERSQPEIDQRRLTWWCQVVPSRYDGWGVVVAEALASGVPVLASRQTGAARDLVRSGLNGRVLDLSDDWSTAILDYSEPERALAEGELARRLGTAASGERAGPWLLQHLTRSGPAADFVQDAWISVLYGR